MNWIIYASLGVIKLLIVCGLVLLSVFILPAILLMFILGMALSFIRDIEPRLYANDQTSIAYASLNHFKTFWVNASAQIITWVHHAMIAKDKPIS